MTNGLRPHFTPYTISLLIALVAGPIVNGQARMPLADPEPPTPSPVLHVHATVETAPMPVGGDAADDPAIWVNPDDPGLSAILGTNKQGGLFVYDLQGKVLDETKDGKLNNVDLRSDFPLSGKSVVLVTAGNRTDDTIAIYTLDRQTRRLTNVAERPIKTAPAYGACMYCSPKSGKFYYVLANKAGQVEMWELADNGRGRVSATKARVLKLGGQLEGCVADDATGILYVGEEDKGIWRMAADPGSSDAPELLDAVGSGRLVADVEGMAIAETGPGTGYLIVSSQGNNSYVVYRREGKNEYVKTFQIVDGDRVDGTADTDGIDVTTRGLGSAFPKGVFVAQDGFNDIGNQNFKLVPLERILDL